MKKLVKVSARGQKIPSLRIEGDTEMFAEDFLLLSVKRLLEAYTFKLGGVLDPNKQMVTYTEAELLRNLQEAYREVLPTDRQG